MLKRMFPVLMAVVTAAAIVIACGEKEDKKETPANAAGVEAAGKLSLDKPSVLFTKAGEAMVSANMTGQGGTGLRPLNVVSASDDRCSRSGHPWDKDANSKMQVEADGYIPKLFYCLLNSKVDDSVETLPGFFKMQSSLICTFEKRLGIKTSDFTETGHEYINDSNKTLTFPPECWPQGTPDNETSVEMTSVKGTKLAESTGWHYEIAIVVPNVDFKMRYFNKDGVFGLVHYREPKNPGGTGHSTTAVVDTNKGVMLYESIEDRNKTPNPDRVIHRVRVKGTFDENLKFSDITEGKGFVYESGDGFAVANDNQHQFWLYTVNGTKEQGFQFKRFENTAADKATVTEKKTECTSGKNCEGATDIGTTAEMKGLFFRTETAETAWKNYLDRKPVCEPATDGAAAIAYSTLLNNTGAFGKCD